MLLNSETHHAVHLCCLCLVLAECAIQHNHACLKLKKSGFYFFSRKLEELRQLTWHDSILLSQKVISRDCMFGRYSCCSGVVILMHSAAF